MKRRRFPRTKVHWEDSDFPENERAEDFWVSGEPWCRRNAFSRHRTRGEGAVTDRSGAASSPRRREQIEPLRRIRSRRPIPGKERRMSAINLSAVVMVYAIVPVIAIERQTRS